jgi:hypothetical protein
MTRIIAGLLAVMLLAAGGCSDKNSVPSGILPHEKMEALMWDVIQAEQYSSAYLLKDSARIDLKLENLRLYDEVFRLHQVSRDEFRKSYQYYMGRADRAQTLFDSLLARGNRLRTESYSRPYRQPVVTTPSPVTTTPSAVPPPAASPNSPVKKLPDSSRRLVDSSRRLRFLNRQRLLKRPDSLAKP